MIDSTQSINPLVDALGAVRTDKQILAALTSRAPFDEVERSLSNAERICRLGALSGLFYPRTEYLHFVQVVEVLLRSGYEGRAHLAIPPQTALYSQVALEGALNPSADCALCVGITGAGKSTLAARTASLWEPLINHGRRTGGLVQLLQIPVLIVTCPSDASQVALVKAFFLALADHLIACGCPGDGWIHRKDTKPDLIGAFKQACKTYAIGVIIWDALENAVASKRRTNRSFITHLLELRDRGKTPFVFIGNYPILELLSMDSRIGRRMSSGGCVIIHRYKSADDPAWLKICELYWSCQWVRNPTPLTPAIIKHLYTLTQGVADYLRILIKSAQELAILTEYECLSVDLLTEAFATRMPATHGPVFALKSGSFKDLRAFPDLSHPIIERDIHKDLAKRIGGANAKKGGQTKGMRSSGGKETTHA